MWYDDDNEERCETYEDTECFKPDYYEEEEEEDDDKLIPDIKLDLNLKEDQLPAAISCQVKVMNVLEQRIKRAEQRAKAAKQRAEITKHDISVFKKKKAIEELQSAVLAQSEALASENSAMRLLFLNQKQLANVSSGLFAFGLMNMTNNRTVYQRLKCELEKASEEELNELAKAELMKIVDQLKAQEDIYNRIERHALIIGTLQEDISSLKNITDTIPTIKSRVESLISTPSTPAPTVEKKSRNGWFMTISIISILISLGTLALVIVHGML